MPKHARPTAAAYLLVGAWSVAEATVWPIMPDALLVPLAFARPRAWWRIVLAAAGGTALGGAWTYRAGRRQSSGGAAWQPPLVRPRMVAAVRGWLASEGARGVRRQPASGVPFKVFAHEAGAMGVPLAPFLGWAVGTRTVRFAVAAGGAALAGQLLPRAITSRPFLLLATWCLVFAGGLWRTVGVWSDPAGTPDRRGELPCSSSAPSSAPVVGVPFL